jgi:tripartite-type tricarboxylate transporter receptor subunit TctC
LFAGHLLGLGVAAFAAASFGMAGNACAQDNYPSRKVTFVVATAPGGYADAVGRIIADKLGARFHQNFIVENRGGGGGNIGARSVISAGNDGYTVLVTTTQLAINETLYKNKGFSTNDLTAISIPVSAPEVIMAHPSNPAKNLSDLVRAAKTTPLVFGSAGIGTGSYIEAQYLFKVLAKVETTHVPFPGGAPALNAILGNQIPTLALTVSPAIASINSGALRGLGIAAPERKAFVPSVPTFAEGGFPNYYASSWVGFFVPAGTRTDVAEKLNAAINDVLNDEGVKRRLTALGAELIHSPLPKTNEYFQGEIKRWGGMVRALDLSVNN